MPYDQQRCPHMEVYARSSEIRSRAPSGLGKPGGGRGAREGRDGGRGLGVWGCAWVVFWLS
jgi:hypothetical protein